MSNALQDKDAQWRARPNGASPVVDPGMAPPGVDSEAGGATADLGTADLGDATTGPDAPLPSPGADGGRGPILPPSYWYAGAAMIAVALIAAALASF